jgi:cytochrome c-type biogenesis protein CcmH
MVWAVAALMALVVVIAILRAFFAVQMGAKASELDVQVYKDQLTSLSSDLDRGVVSEGEADAARLEISRRILAADKRAQDEDVANDLRISKPLLALIALVLFAGSMGLYGLVGSPRIPDQPLAARLEEARIARAQRPNQVEAEVQIPAEKSPEGIPEDYLELVTKLRDTMKEQPNDVEGWKLLAMHEARIGNIRAAWRAKDRVITLLGDKTKASDYTDLAEYMIVATNGYVSTDAEETLSKSLRMDAKSPRTRYYSGLALAQNGRPDIAYRMWAGLLDEGPEDAPWIGAIRGQIGSVARAAGVNVADQNAPGPSSEQIEEAKEMTPEERQEMIHGMVSGLAERLETDGGTAAEWARLIRAYGTLGETGKASDTWGKARESFNGDANALAILMEAAQAAEVAN